ncbi:hypothetical protein G3435_20065, partial [Pseudomonas sp. MAFF212428]|nr:hypothetical protein [Pseudomonas brassicae]
MFKRARVGCFREVHALPLQKDLVVMKCLTRAHVGPLLFSVSAALLAGCQSIKPMPAPTAMVLPVCINDECAVLDQNGVVQVSVDNDYDAVYDAPMNST